MKILINLWTYWCFFITFLVFLFFLPINLILIFLFGEIGKEIFVRYNYYVAHILIFFYGMRFLQNENFQNSTIAFKVVFKNSQGIDSGDEVRMLGKKIGYIKGTSIIGQNIIIDVSISNIYAYSIPFDSLLKLHLLI